jgi:ketosteroid isomerase-like protein
VTRTRDESEALASRVWQLVGAGSVADGLSLLDDGGTWWDMATRDDGPMTRMKALLAETFALVPMEFTLVGSIVEGDRVALMVESFADLPDGGKYNNVYTFITTLHPDKDVIIGIREYVDTAHAYQTLVPSVLGAAEGSAMAELLGDER